MNTTSILTDSQYIILAAIAEFTPFKRATLAWLTGIAGSKVGSELRRLRNHGWAVFSQGQWRITASGRTALNNLSR